jgi:type II secretory pathway predicted ATPase ExeA
MVTDFYDLREEPFGATPDSRYLFESGTHREALASLLYGVQAGRGFMALIAKPGMGKTTLLFRALSQLREQGRTVFLFQTMPTPLDLLRTLLADLGVQDLHGGVFELQTKLNEILVEYASRGEQLVVVIDETQNLDDSVLEMVRMLSNFETQEQKLMQIILAGQPQLAQRLRSPSLLQLRQRISMVAHLQAFSAEETEQYVEHRLQVAGYGSNRPLFTRGAMHLIAQQSEGIPRNINTLCFNALSIGCTLKRKTIDEDIIREVISDLDLAPLGQELAMPSDVTPAPKPSPAGRRLSPIGGWLLKGALATSLLLLLSAVPMHDEPRAAVLAGARGTETSAITVPTTPVRPTIPDRTPPAIGTTAPESEISPANSTSSAADPPAPEKHPASVPTVSASPHPEKRRLQIDAQERILVPPGITLYEICRETMKDCRSTQIDAIRQLNPWLTNPDHLESGRKLRIPPVAQMGPNGIGPSAADRSK